MIHVLDEEAKRAVSWLEDGVAAAAVVNVVEEQAWSSTRERLASVEEGVLRSLRDGVGSCEVIGEEGT